MSKPPTFDQRSVGRGLGLGIGVFLVFVVVAGGLWALGGALGLGKAAAFFLAACAAPILVALPLLLWLAGMSPERRQALVGFKPPDRPNGQA